MRLIQRNKHMGSRPGQTIEAHNDHQENQPVDAASLRCRAEAKLSERKRKAAARPSTESDPLRLVHELEVHRIELEMQNEELIKLRVQAEAGLRKYIDLYDTAPVSYFTLAPDGTIHEANLAGATMLGVVRGLLIKRRFGVFVSTESRSVFNLFIEKTFGSLEKEVCEVALQRDGSASLWVRIEAITEDGHREVCHAAVVDITERRVAEKALLESEYRLRRFYESGMLGVFYWNLDGEITEGNDKFLEIVGYTRDDLKSGKIDWVQMTPSEYRYLDENAVKELKAMGVNRTPFEKEYMRKDGTRIPIIIAGAMLDEERFNGIAFVLDNSDRKWIEEQTSRINEDLEQKVKERTAELRESIIRLEELNRVFVDRELKMIELKERIAELERK